MTSKQIKILRQAFRLMAKEFGYPKYNCPEYEEGCWQCRTKHFMEIFDSRINDIIDAKNWDKKWKEKRKKDKHYRSKNQK